MRVWHSLARHEMPRRFAWLACALLLALAPLTLTGQAPATQAAPTKAAAAPSQAPAPKEAAPLSWADKILQQETYATPPPELATAITAPRNQNVSLANISQDKKWFLALVGDGPVAM